MAGPARRAPTTTRSCVPGSGLLARLVHQAAAALALRFDLLVGEELALALRVELLDPAAFGVDLVVGARVLATLLGERCVLLGLARLLGLVRDLLSALLRRLVLLERGFGRGPAGAADVH